MVKDWNNLSRVAQDYINQRFSIYDINGQKAFSDNLLFPDEIKELESNEIIEILKTKDISHVMPSSQYPELKYDINNIILEDISTNRARGAKLMSKEELNFAKEDYFKDIDEFEDNLVFFESLPEVLIGSTTIGLGLSSIKAYNKIRKNEILLNEAPRFIIIDSGGKIIKCAIIGVCATSGSPILVASAFAYILYKAKDLIIHTTNVIWNLTTHETTKNLAVGTVKATGIILAGTAKGTWNLATHKTTKNLAIGTVKATGIILAGTAKGTWNLATHKTTKNVAIGTVKTTGKIVSGTVKGIWKIAKWSLKK
mgnify:CR=1 FL=1